MATLPSPTQVAGDNFAIYEAWFRKLDPNGTGSIPAVVAAQFLKKSALNDNILSRIWDLSDPSGKGYLDKGGLFVALKLVALVQNGKDLSLAHINTVAIAPNMGDALTGAKNSGPPTVPAPPTPSQVNSGVWTITPADRTRYDQVFNSLGPEANKVHGNKVRAVMMNSKLPVEILGKIWDLSDMDKDGSLDRVEFSIAMHLIYKLLENNPLPVTLPQEMISSARRAGVAQGPIPAPLAPPSEASQEVNQIATPAAPWVVTSSDMARYNVMFHNADLDKDGFVSGQEIKGVFLQSGLSQMVLAHIWNLCDMKQSGKLNCEQFALAMWLIQQKISGSDPPASLTAEMMPPSMRPKAETVVQQAAVAKPTYTNAELQAVADEIEALSSDKLKLDAEIQQKEANIRVKNNELKSLQTELDTLTATLKQLENQKGAAQKRLDDLGQQKEEVLKELSSVEEDIIFEMQQVQTLREQVDEQEQSLREQEKEVMSKQLELQELRAQEVELEASVLSMKNSLDKISTIHQQTQLHISQARMKIEELQDQERHLTEVLTSYDSAISVGDASSVSEASLRDFTPLFNDPQYLHVGPETPPVVSPVLETPVQENGLSEDSRVKDTSFVGGHDPFASAFGGAQAVASAAGDPFSSWDNKQKTTPPATHADPFGGSAFSDGKADAFGGDAFKDTDASETPALPPKKAKQPPPRPAPPKARPAKPPPPQINSNNNQDWSKANNDAFADFANFADFDSKYCSFPVCSTTTKSAWGDDSTKTNDSAWTHSSSASLPSNDPFGDAFTANSPSGSSGFESAAQTPNDPFGTDYDPFRDISQKQDFSWDDEQDPYLPEAPPTDPFADLSDEEPASLFVTGGKVRSKSVLADPFSRQAPVAKPRSKTSLGSLVCPFDPLTNTNTQAPHYYKSNEDLLNENLSPSAWSNNNNNNWSSDPFAPSKDANLPLSKSLAHTPQSPWSANS